MFTERRRLAPLALLFGLVGCSSETPEPDSGGIAIGLLLPFTGSSSATASNLERATLYAADRINAGGGIDGKPVHIISRDTHSEVDRGVEEAKFLRDKCVDAVIGPESAGIAEAIRPELSKSRSGCDHDTALFISPLVGAGEEPSGQCTEAWFRLAPSAKSIGEALAKQANDHAVHRVAIMYSNSPYDQALGQAAAERFPKLVSGNEVALEVELDPDAQSYASAVREANAAGVTNVILAVSPRAGAILVNEFDALSSQRPQWFLSPLLKTELLVQNVAPQALEGALGVAPGIYERDGGFPEAFSMRWQGDQPLEGAYFYYDAMALLAMALGKAAKDPSLTLEAALLAAAKPIGEPVSWDGIEDGLDRIHKGKLLYYSGLTGPLRLQACGSRASGLTTDWTVTQGTIVTL
jgi:neutral amino acid transport system substrate-binding protein